MSIKGKKYIVYIHRNLINKKVYVGMTSYGKVRWRKDGKGYKQNAQMWLDICEYGWDNFEHIVYAENLSLNKAKYIERSLIKELKSNNPECGYNKSNGGECGTLGCVGHIKDCYGFKHPRSHHVYSPELDEVFGSINQAAMYSGTNSGTISDCLKGKRKTAGKCPFTGRDLTWVYTIQND